MALAGVEMPTKKTSHDSGKKPEFTTFRIHVEDGEDLSELADKRGMSVANLYRAMFAETVRQELVKEARKRLQDLESRKP